MRNTLRVCVAILFLAGPYYERGHPPLAAPLRRNQTTHLPRTGRESKSFARQISTLRSHKIRAL